MPTNKVVYTAITGGYDNLKLNQGAKDVDYVAFLENPEVSKIGVWEVRDINKYLPKEYRKLDNNRRAKWFKLHPHKLFGKEYKYSIWIDGNVETQKDLGELTESIKRWGVFKHFQRDCILEEMYICAKLRLDDPFLMKKQISNYINNYGYPIHNGLVENGVIIRNHNDRRVKALCSRWWQEILMWSKRDQLSFVFVAWNSHLRYELMDGTVYKNDWFKVYTHAN